MSDEWADRYIRIGPSTMLGIVQRALADEWREGWIVSEMVAAPKGGWIVVLAPDILNRSRAVEPLAPAVGVEPGGSG